MPIKRRASKPRDHRITLEAVDAFKAAEELGAIYDACNETRGQSCRSDEPGRKHCAECSEYLDQCNNLDRLLGLNPWECSPVRARAPDPGERGLWAESVAQAMQLRAELLTGIDPADADSPSEQQQQPR